MGSADGASSAMIDLMVIPPGGLVGWSRVAAGVGAPAATRSLLRAVMLIVGEFQFVGKVRMGVSPYRDSISYVYLGI
jgi:hypothetical protein